MNGFFIIEQLVQKNKAKQKWAANNKKFSKFNFL